MYVAIITHLVGYRNSLIRPQGPNQLHQKSKKPDRSRRRQQQAQTLCCNKSVVCVALRCKSRNGMSEP